MTECLGQIALKKAGIDYRHYYASEIDTHAIKVAKQNNPEMVHLGDVTKWREWDVDWSKIGLLMAGSPCQGFSFSGKGLGFEDPRSKLFFVFIDILKHIKSKNNSVKFLLENVQMRKEHMKVINEFTGVKPVFINSLLVSAQNRKRFYWTNWFFKAPNDKNIRLVDVIETGVVDRKKSYCIDANYGKGGNLHQYFDKSRRQLVFSDDVETERFFSKKKGTLAYKKSVGQVRVLSDKSNCLTTSGQNFANSGSTNIIYKNLSGLIGLRTLTPLECERLQTVPEGYTSSVSKTQRYRMLGNGWTVNVIVHILLSKGTGDLMEPAWNRRVHRRLRSALDVE